jgi:DNA-binding beta-propeller fold protein YncE
VTVSVAGSSAAGTTLADSITSESAQAASVAAPLRYSHTVGHYSVAGRGFANPVDLAFSSDGAVYVVSRGNPRHAETDVRISVCTLAEEELFHFATFGTGDGEFVWATAIAIDAQDRLYVADEHRHDVQVFAKDGTFLHTWGSAGSAPGQLNRPAGLAVDPSGNVVVVDHLNFRIQTFTPEGELVACWGVRGDGPGQFDLPWGVTVGSDGLVYVADWNNNRVQKLTPDGAFVMGFGGPGDGPDCLYRPSSVAVDADGWVYVADRGNHRVQVYGPGGGHLGMLIGDSQLSPWAEEVLGGNPDLVAERALADMTTEQRFWIPTAVALANDGRLCVLEAGRHRIQVYART